MKANPRKRPAAQAKARKTLKAISKKPQYLITLKSTPLSSDEEPIHEVAEQLYQSKQKAVEKALQMFSRAVVTNNQLYGEDNPDDLRPKSGRRKKRDPDDDYHLSYPLHEIHLTSMPSSIPDTGVVIEWGSYYSGRPVLEASIKKFGGGVGSQGKVNVSLARKKALHPYIRSAMSAWRRRENFVYQKQKFSLIYVQVVWYYLREKEAKEYVKCGEGSWHGYENCNPMFD